MRALERDILLFVLAVSAGSADGWSYFGLGHSFVANMTGNTVLLGVAVFEKNGDLLHPFLSLTCYLAGVAIASLFTRKTRPGRIWSKAISGTLAVEAALMIGAECGWIALHRPAEVLSAPPLKLLLACVALAVGLQSGAMLRLKIPGVVTTYITGTWTTLASGLVGLTMGPRAQEERREEFEQRLWMQAGILTAYFFSALVTGLLFRVVPQAVGALPATSVTLVAGYSAFRCGGIRDG